MQITGLDTILNMAPTSFAVDASCVTAISVRQTAEVAGKAQRRAPLESRTGQHGVPCRAGDSDSCASLGQPCKPLVFACGYSRPATERAIDVRTDSEVCPMDVRMPFRLHVALAPQQ